MSQPSNTLGHMTHDTMMKAALEQRSGPRAPRKKLFVVLASIGVAVLLVGAVFGVKAATDYRADMEAMQTSAADDRAAITEQVAVAQQAATQAAQSARDAQGAVDSKVAAEEALAAAEAAAAAQAAAEAAAQASDQARKPSTPAGPIKCPAGSQANSGDGPNDTSCFPVVCFTIELPDPAHPECVTAFKP